jgi:hypothetical protein
MALDWTDYEEALKRAEIDSSNLGSCHMEDLQVNVYSGMENVLQTIGRLRLQVMNLESDMQALHGKQQIPVGLVAHTATNKWETQAGTPDRADQLSDLLFIARGFLDCSQKDMISPATSQALKALRAKVEELEA